jgi:hypothetical protein
MAATSLFRRCLMLAVVASCSTGSMYVSSDGVHRGSLTRGGREIKWNFEGSGRFCTASSQDSFTLNTRFGRVTIEESRVLLGDEEVARLPAGTLLVDVRYEEQILKVLADEFLVYQATIAD